MAVTANCFIASAQNILKIPSAAEPEFRNAVSRAYYGAYHYAKEYSEQALSIDIDNFAGPTHKKLSEALTNYTCSDKDKQRIIQRAGVRLAIFHALRIRADYGLADMINQKDADSQIRNSLEFISALQSA
ncbi:hypothetical protein [Aquipseudomonas alcaligenes]|uniref:hypothetical protein n=1 Tax=Aquipseudomonas alcaligenes TaxID=43263 RepID=UPI0037497016